MTKAEVTRIVKAGTDQFSDAHLLLHQYFNSINVVIRDDDDAIRTFLCDTNSALWIAYVNDTPAACVAMKPLPNIPGAVECKRLYVVDHFRRHGLAQKLMKVLETEAALAGHSAVYLDTNDELKAAITLYERLGYKTCPRYNNNPQATLFMCKQLNPQTIQ